MRKLIPFFLILFFAPHYLIPQQLGFQFISPLPGSELNRKETTITIRKGPRLIWPASLSASSVQLSGTVSGSHAYSAVLSDDERTMIVKPVMPFAPGEIVTVKLDDRLKTETGAPVGPVQFSFTISPIELHPPASLTSEMTGTAVAMKPRMNEVHPLISTASDSLLPPYFPPITEIVDRIGRSRWSIYICNMIFDYSITTTPYLMVLNTAGSPVWSRELSSFAFDFKWQPTGRMTYFDSNEGGYVVLDSSYKPVDTVFCGNGYSTDLHEFRMLPNGHSFIMGADFQLVAMNQVVPGGDQNAQVRGLVVQELDQNKNVVFQWRSFDHIAITDAIGVDLTSSSIDPVHGNALEIDSDTSIVISSRHLSEITKIDRRTGSIIWRWGGKENQFTFIHDTLGFSFQHAIRKLANGHFILFDNGNIHIPPFSRAVEYDLDEKAKTATLVWSYRHTPDIYGYAMGNVQRLDDGSSLIGWGSTNPTLTLIDSHDSTLAEMSLPEGVYSYRAYAYPGQTLTAVSPASSNQPKSTALFQNYPNPFNPSTVIMYQLTDARMVQLKVYDMLGRAIITLVDKIQQPGSYAIPFDSQKYSLTSGVYFYRIFAGQYSEVKKMIVLK